MKKTLIFDLDNTIYPVNAIAGHLFAGLFAILDEYAAMINASAPGKVDRIKEEMTRRPFQYIADKYELDGTVQDRMLDILRNMTYDLPMQPFPDYLHTRTIALDKFLVTTGFPKLQYSKIAQLGIAHDFREIFVVDPDLGNLTKKDVFAAIMEKYRYVPSELLVIGDDPDSEIKAALELGIDTFLFDPGNMYQSMPSTFRSHTLKDVPEVLK